MNAYRFIAVAFALGRLTGADLLRPAAPAITGVLNARQELTCPEATQTVCPDGSGGCCPSGAACTFVSGQPRCQQSSGRGPLCLDGGCCSYGYKCDLVGDFCFPDPTTSNSIPPLTVLTFDLPVYSSLGPIEPTPTIHTMLEPTEPPPRGPGNTQESTSISTSSSVSEPTTIPEPTTTSSRLSSSGSAAPSTNLAGTASDTTPKSSTLPSTTPPLTESPTSTEDSGAASPSTSPGIASSLSVGWGFWTALAIVVLCLAR